MPALALIELSSFVFRPSTPSSMYSPAQFRVPDLASAVALIRMNSFGLLVSSGDEGMTGTHLPFLVTEPTAEHEHGALLVHVARANPVWKTFGRGREVLVLFQGTHGYISPSWYETAADQPHVPTWNYEAVHVYGVPRLIEDEAAVIDLLHRTVDNYEPAGSAYQSRSLPSTYLAANAKAVVAFEIPIQRWETKLKMSQNRDVRDVLSVLAHLDRAGDPASRQMAAAIRSANQSRLPKG